MISWIIVIILVVLAFVFAKFRHIKHKTFLIVLIIAFLLFYITASSVLGGNANLKSFDGIVAAGKAYFSWLVHIGSNAKTIAGSAVNMDWAGNITNSITAK